MENQIGTQNRFVYEIFGLILVSNFPLTFQPAHCVGTADLTLTCVDHCPLFINWEQVKPTYASSNRTDGGESAGHLYRLDACDVLRFTHVTDFYLWLDRIVCHLLDPTQDHMVGIHLLGTVLSFWLERQGIPALHASAVVADGRVAAFLSCSTSGKSVLAAALMQGGYPLLTDDILPVERSGGAFVGRPGYPQIRLWPDEAQHFLGHYQDLERVHPELSKRRVPVGPDGFGTFCDESQPLACIYLPERRDPAQWGTEIEITPVSPRDAVIELVRHSFTPRVVEAIGLQPQRLDFFAQMVQQVPMRRLAYPSGFEHLPRVREAILEDLETLS
ncbi:MAG: hypothetical protein FJ014_15260 [Chloroflexi bacterium]|nr:hypothetical protein [Chloroflexota bacterium]